MNSKPLHKMERGEVRLFYPGHLYICTCCNRLMVPAIIKCANPKIVKGPFKIMRVGSQHFNLWQAGPYGRIHSKSLRISTVPRKPYISTSYYVKYLG